MRPETKRALGDVCGHPEKGPQAPLCPRELGREENESPRGKSFVKVNPAT